MAHTCPSCGVPTKIILAPTEVGAEEVRNGRFGTGRKGSHDITSWKSQTRARKQYLRHGKKA